MFVLYKSKLVKKIILCIRKLKHENQRIPYSFG